MLKLDHSSSVRWKVAHSLLLVAVWVFAALSSAPTAFAVTRYVSPTGKYVITIAGKQHPNYCYNPKKPCKSINWAVSHAQSGDTISVAAGHYVENVSVSKNLTIKGVGAYLVDTPITWVDGNKQGNVFTVAATATIKSMLISNGKNGISNDGNLTVEGCLVGGSDGAGDGSGIKNLANGTLVLKRVWLVGNKSAGLFNVGSATLDEIWAFANKDGIVNGPMPTSSLDVSNSVIWNNKMVGVVNHETKKLSMQNVTISGNEQTGLEQYGKLASLDYVTISKNGVETNGQGIRAAEGGGGVTITHSIVYGNGPPGANQCTYTSTVGSVASNPFTDGGYNVFADNSGCQAWPNPSSKTDNPKLKALSRDDTKPNITLTHALEWGSAAVDLVPKSECISRDQRNVARPIDGKKDGTLECDAGAYEFKQ